MGSPFSSQFEGDERAGNNAAPGVRRYLPVAALPPMLYRPETGQGVWMLNRAGQKPASKAATIFRISGLQACLLLWRLYLIAEWHGCRTN